MTYACNTAYLPSFLSQMGNQLPWGMPLYPGSGMLAQESAHTKNQAIFLAIIFRARFSLCPNAKAMCPQHITAWSTFGPGWHKDDSEGIRTEQPCPHTSWWTVGGFQGPFTARDTQSQASWLVKQNASTVGLALLICKTLQTAALERRGLHF